MATEERVFHLRIAYSYKIILKKHHIFLLNFQRKWEECKNDKYDCRCAVRQKQPHSLLWGNRCLVTITFLCSDDLGSADRNTPEHGEIANDVLLLGITRTQDMPHHTGVAQRLPQCDNSRLSTSHKA